MRRIWISTATGLVLAAASLVATALGSPQAKAFPAGCWIGTSPFTGTFASGPVKAKVTGGKLKLVLWVGNAKPMPPAVGFMTATGIGAGSLSISGSELALEVKVVGDYDLTGTASAVKANGTYTMKGNAVGTGQFLPNVPVNIKLPVKNAPLKTTTVSGRRVTGLFGKAHWSVTRRTGAPSKDAGACANAG